jgi:hypothetical protein
MPIYLYSDRNEFEIGPFKAKSRVNAKNLVKRAFKRDLENGEIPDLRCIKKLTEKQLHNIFRNCKAFS